jgi:hypothetical protein
VTLTNNQSVILNIASISFVGVHPGDYAQTNNCSAGVGAGSSCMIMVTFTPLAKGTRNATLNIADSAGNSPQTVKLTGAGQ